MKHRIKTKNLHSAAQVWIYLSMIVLSWAQATHSSSSNFYPVVPIINEFIADYTGQSVCEIVPQDICDITNAIIAGNAGQNIATKFPAATNVMNNLIDAYSGINAIPILPKITFGTPSAAATVTISNASSGNNIAVTGSGATTIVAQGEPVVHIFAGSSPEPFTPSSGTVQFVADAGSDGVVMNADVYIYGSLALATSGTKLTINGNLYLDNQPTGLNSIDLNSGQLNVTGTIYVQGAVVTTTNVTSDLLLTSNMVVQDGVILSVNGSSSVTIASGSTLTATEESTILIATSGSVEVMDGGTLNLNSSASFTIASANGILIINDGATVNVNAGTMQSYGTVQINHATVTLSNHATMSIDGSGASLVLQSGGSIMVSNNSSLTVQNDSLMNIVDGNVSAASSAGPSQVIVTSGAELQLQGAGVINLNAGGKISVNNAGTILHLYDGAIVNINNNGELSLFDNTTMTMESGSNLNLATSAAMWVDPSANAQLLNVGQISFNGSVVANVDGDALTYHITGNTGTETLALQDNNSTHVADITTPTSIQTGPYVAASGRITFGTPDDAVVVTISSGSTLSDSSIVVTGPGASTIVATGSPVVHIVTGSNPEPFTPSSGTVQFSADSLSQVIVDGDMYIYGDLVFADGASLLVNGDVYLDSSAANNTITSNSFTLTGTLYIRGNGQHQTTLDSSTFYIASTDIPRVDITGGGILYVGMGKTLALGFGFDGPGALTISADGTLLVDDGGTCSMEKTSNITISTGGKLIVDNSTGNDYGRVIISDSSTLTVDGGTLTLDNSSGAYASLGGKIQMSGSNPQNLIINDGGMVLVDNSSQSNDDSFGGAITAQNNSTITVNAGGTLKLDSSGIAGTGGSLSMDGIGASGHLTITGGAVILDNSNSYTNTSGHIFLADNTIATMSSNATFTLGNSSNNGGKGGSLEMANDATLTITNSTLLIDHTGSGGDGGMLQLHDTSHVIIEDGGILIVDNHSISSNYGGQISVDSEGPIVDVNDGGMLILDNNTPEDGSADGGSFSSFGSVNINNGGTMRIDNHAAGPFAEGGWFQNYAFSLPATGLTIKSGGTLTMDYNSASEKGGFLSISGALLTVEPDGIWQLLKIGKITGPSTLVNVSGNALTYYIVGSTTDNTLTLQNNLHVKVADLSGTETIQNRAYTP